MAALVFLAFPVAVLAGAGAAFLGAGWPGILAVFSAGGTLALFAVLLAAALDEPKEDALPEDGALIPGE